MEIGRDTVIYPGTLLEGGTKIGGRCVIGPYTRISDSVVCEDVYIMNSVVLESQIGSNSSGAFCLSASGSSIGIM